jgi:hypothetical protein
MAIGLLTAIRTARAQLIVDAIDAGSGAGTLKLYTAPKPATGAAVGAATLLGTLTFADPCGTVTTGTLTFSAITKDSAADADGTAAWARVADSAGTFVMDMTVGLVGSGADIIMNNVVVVTGGEISITNFATIVEGNA